MGHFATSSRLPKYLFYVFIRGTIASHKRGAFSVVVWGMWRREWDIKTSKKRGKKPSLLSAKPV